MYNTASEVGPQICQRHDSGFAGLGLSSSTEVLQREAWEQKGAVLERAWRDVA